MNKFNKKAVKILIPAILFISILGITYTVFMIKDTDSIIERANQHFSGQLASDPTDVLNRYNYYKKIEGYTPEPKRVEYTLERKTVWHNFKDGFIDVVYTCYYYDENNILGMASGPIPSRWIIHKENGQWKVVDIIEAP